MKINISFLVFLLLAGTCNSKIASDDSNLEEPGNNATGLADVVSVIASGEAGNYQFAVGINSPDIDCDQYADWWEIVSTDGTLLYRRILTHSHPSEQPFVRSGGPVEIPSSEEVVIRAHMHPSGYGGTAHRGSVDAGFKAVQLPANFALELAEKAPLPTICTS